jgi:hypothetical protein
VLVLATGALGYVTWQKGTDLADARAQLDATHKDVDEKTAALSKSKAQIQAAEKAAADKDADLRKFEGQAGALINKLHISAISMRVEGKNDEWASAGVVAHPGDVVAIFASGFINNGSVGDSQFDADGCLLNGRCQKSSGLAMKVGDETVHAGSSFVWMSTATGPVKLRFIDDAYTDNSGEYSVELLLIPASAIPTPRSP